MTESNEPLLTIRDLHLEGRTDEEWIPIIKGVDLTLDRGEVLGLIGESGAGKSTLGLAAMGYCRDGVRVSRGTVKFDGIDLFETSLAKSAPFWASASPMWRNRRRRPSIRRTRSSTSTPRRPPSTA